MKLGVFANLSKLNADVALHALIAELDSLGATYFVDEGIGAAIGSSLPTMSEDRLLSECDILIAVGGDGTIIHTAKKAAAFGKPVLGINAGRVGYMACLEVGELSLLSRLFSGEYSVEERRMLEARTSCQPDKTFYCLNEVEVSKTDASNMLDLSVDNGNDTFMSFRADGMVLATPTGSTAYAMAAGGPVTDPTLDCMILVPICSMSMYSRGFVLSPESDIRIRFEDSDGANAVVKFDGAAAQVLRSGETVSVRRSADRVTKLIKIKNDSFYSILKHKMTDL